jgi:hypothetical protein
MSKHYEFVKRKPQGSILLFLLLIIDMMLWSFTFYLLAIFATFLTFAILIQPTGYIIDKDKKRIKIINGFISHRIGKWKKLPEVKYVSLLRVKHIDNLHQTNPALYNPKTTHSSNYLVNLVIKENWQKERPVKLISTSKENAIHEGLKLGEYLGLKVLDQTTHEKHWIR